VKEQAREAWAFAWLESVLQDVRFAGRGLIRQPSLAVAAIATLAIGIGAMVAVLAAVEGVLRRPLHYPGADRVVQIMSHRTDPAGPVRTGTQSLPYFMGMRERAQGQSGVGGYDSFSSVTRQRLAATIAGKEGAARLLGTRMSPALFPTLGTTSMLGRVFEQAEEQQGHNAVVILSHRTWQNVYGANRNVLGESFISTVAYPFSAIPINATGSVTSLITSVTMLPPSSRINSASIFFLENQCIPIQLLMRI
jgi:hypothetical protein